MSKLLSGARSAFSLLCVAGLFMAGSLVLRLGVLPRFWLHPERRFHLVSAYMKWMARWILNFLTLGGARFRRAGGVPTGSPVLIVANHQSLLDILQVALLAEPFVPAFVTRKRYARFVPLVSATMRLLGCPIVDPKGDPRGALRAMDEAARGLPHGILIFPEGHRTRDGEILPFRRAGLLSLLEAKRAPVYLAVGDGLWKAGRFLDLLFKVHEIDAGTEALGPFEPPPDAADLPLFIQTLRQRMVERLRAIRAERAESRAPAAERSLPVGP